MKKLYIISAIGVSPHIILSGILFFTGKAELWILLSILTVCYTVILLGVFITFKNQHNVEHIDDKLTKHHKRHE